MSPTYHLHYIKPTSLEVVIASVLIFCMIGFSVFDLVFKQLGLGDPLPMLLLILNVSMRSLLSWLDSFGATSDIVLFGLWGTVGLLVFILIQTFRQMTSNLFYMVEFTSRKYRHPSGFSTQRYWLHVLLTGFEIIAGLIAGFTLFFVIFSLSIPMASNEFRLVLSNQLTLDTFVRGLLFTAIAWGSSYLLIVVGRFILYRHNIIPD